MISSLPDLLTIYTLLLLKAFFINPTEMQHLKREAQQIFGYNFNTPLEKGSVLIWKISGNEKPFTQLQYNGENIQLGSKETYLLVSKEHPLILKIHYWFGGNTSLVAKKKTAKYAVYLNSIYNPPWINMSREIEGTESDSFQNTVKVFNRQAGFSMENDKFAFYLDRHFPSPRPNLYVIWGETDSVIKRIPLSLGVMWLTKTDACLILESEYKVEEMLPMNIYCGVNTNQNHIKKTRNFAASFKYYYTYQGTNCLHEVENNKGSIDFKQFVEILENSRLYNPNEVDDSKDHLKNATEFVIDRNREILLFDVTSEGLKVNSTRPFLSGMFQCDNSMGYLFDSKSAAGVFLVFADSEKMKDRIKAIKLAEEYMDEKYPLVSGKIMRMRIVETKPINYIRDFEINFSDYFMN